MHYNFQYVVGSFRRHITAKIFPLWIPISSLSTIDMIRRAHNIETCQIFFLQQIPFLQQGGCLQTSRKQEAVILQLNWNNLLNEVGGLGDWCKVIWWLISKLFFQLFWPDPMCYMVSSLLLLALWEHVQTNNGSPHILLWEIFYWRFEDPVLELWRFEKAYFAWFHGHFSDWRLEDRVPVTLMIQIKTSCAGNLNYVGRYWDYFAVEPQRSSNNTVFHALCCCGGCDKLAVG